MNDGNCKKCGLYAGDCICPDGVATGSLQRMVSPHDIFERWQVIEWMDTVPLGYITQRDHEITDALVTKMQRLFAELPTDWKPSED